MKKLFIAALLFPSLSFGAPFDLFINQRNIADLTTLSRTVPLPMQNVDSVFGISSANNLPILWKLGSSMGILNGELVAFPDWSVVQNKPVFATVATSGDYNDLTNKPSTSAQVNSDWAASSGVEQILNKPTTLAGYGISDAYPLAGNPAGFLTDITGGQVTAALGFTPYNATNPSVFVTQAGARSAISLTTTGTGGAATYNSSTGVLNVPNYAPGTGTVTSVTAGAGLSGGTFTTSGTISMPATGTAGTYTNVTTDAQGRVTSGLNASINDNPARSLVTTTASTGFQVSATRNAMVCYEGSFSTTSSIGGPSAASVFLETADTNSTTPGDWTTKASQSYSNNITLAIVLNQVQGNNWSMCRVIPAGKFVRIRSGSITGTASASINAQQQEVLQ